LGKNTSINPDIAYRYSQYLSKGYSENISANAAIINSNKINFSDYDIEELALLIKKLSIWAKKLLIS